MNDHNTAAEFSWTVGLLERIVNSPSQRCSKSFSFGNGLSAKFALFVDSSKCHPGRWENIRMGVIVQKMNEKKPMVVRIQFRIRSSDGTVSDEHVAERFEFKVAGQRCVFKLKSEAEKNFFYTLYHMYTSASFTCQVTFLNFGWMPNPYHKLGDKLWKLNAEDGECDATIVASGLEFKIMRCVFAAHSEAFRTMFSTKFKEGLTRTANFDDISAPVMEALIRWMYTGEIQSKELIKELYIVADKYVVKDLKSHCGELIVEALTDENAADYLVLATKHNDEELQKKIWAFVHNQGADLSFNVIQSSVWCNYLSSIHIFDDQI